MSSIVLPKKRLSGRRVGLALAVVGTMLLTFALPRAVALADTRAPDWQTPVKKIPVTAYASDARTYIGDPAKALKPLLTDKQGTARVDAVLADVDTRFFDGSRLLSRKDGDEAYPHLAHLASYLKAQLTNGKAPVGPTGTAHVNALVGTLTGARQLADAAIQDLDVTTAPFLRTDGTAATPAPAGLQGAVDELRGARDWFAKADKELKKAQPEPALQHLQSAWQKAFQALLALGVTYSGDKDADGVTDVVELRFGASPLVVDSDADGLTDKFEIYELAGWTVPNSRDSDKDGISDGAEDVDGDGLTNLDEQRLGTAPLRADTDGDGVNDGTEVAQGSDPLKADQPRGPPLGGGAPPIVPTPTLTDTDGDGLEDIFEEEAGTNPNNPDSDGDGLSDGDEVNLRNTDALKADTDDDGFRDDYEVAHAEDQGLDPLIPDEKISKWTYVSDFLLGLFAGDFAPRDSMAWLSGYLCSGGLSFIPVVGWILGGLADLRDTIAAVIHGDWVGGGLSIIGLVPYVGDAVAIPGKAAKFALKYLHRLDRVIRLVAKYNKIPDSVKTLAIRAILLGNYGKLTDAGLTEAMIIRLAGGARTSLPKLADALTDVLHRSGIAAPWLTSGAAGEDWLTRAFRAEGKFGARPPDTLTETPLGRRWPDFIEELPSGGDISHEIKTGIPGFKDLALKQCQKDGLLRRAGTFVDTIWHFLPYGPENSLGPPDYLLDCLRREGIPFTIHLPNSA